MRYVFLIALGFLLSACTRTVEHLTPKEQDEQETRMRYFLEESSPRNMDGHAKVTPEFTKTFNSKSSSTQPESTLKKELKEEEDLG